MAEIIVFPQHRVTQVYARRPPAGATPKEEAIFRVRQLRAERNRHTPSERQYHVAGIHLNWWEGELARLVGEQRAPTRLMEDR